jgi:hypothetical protein
LPNGSFFALANIFGLTHNKNMIFEGIYPDGVQQSIDKKENMEL